MKFIIYKGQKKFTINNAWLPESDSLSDLITDDQIKEITMPDLQLYDLRITATRGIDFEFEELDSEEIVKEIYEGINWHQETVN